jgi:predicted 3-demethylubiquinone-9 3-methyltransferase (glyoxalase superfamily)
MVQAPNGKPSRWGVDFWIDNADAGAMAAAKFGGTIIGRHAMSLDLGTLFSKTPGCDLLHKPAREDLMREVTMQKITPFLWFDNQAEEAAKLYASLFERSKIGSIRRYGDAGPGPKGQVMTLSFQLAGLGFMALNGGPLFAFTPAISLFISCSTEKEIDTLWSRLAADGQIFMELRKYPFSEKFGWVRDRFGLTWQLNFAGRLSKITPFFMFVGTQHGRSEEAMKYWGTLFKNSRVDYVECFGEREQGAQGTVKHARFTLAGQEFMAMDSNKDHSFTFNEAISLYVDCATQSEVDELWEKLSEGGETGQCGWIKDRFGVSWQIVPSVLGQLLADKDPLRAGNVMQAMLKMKKLDIKTLQEAAR